ncbi:MAG: hypothetical protein AAGJ37_04255 [Pseudomonadota bacterium]
MKDEQDADVTQAAVALWRLNALRLIYLLIFVGISSFVWSQLLFESASWPVMTGLAKSMMAAMALLSLLGIRYPLQMLPVLIWETLWKTIWILFIAIPAFSSEQWPIIESVFYESVGIVIVYFLIPWPYVWARFIRQPGEQWR